MTTPDDRPVLFITYAWDDPDKARIEDISGSLKAARRWMRGRSGFVYRYDRQADGTYAHARFVEVIGGHR